jgi:hypothetical protein
MNPFLFAAQIQAIKAEGIFASNKRAYDEGGINEIANLSWALPLFVGNPPLPTSRSTRRAHGPIV